MGRGLDVQHDARPVDLDGLFQRSGTLDDLPIPHADSRRVIKQLSVLIVRCRSDHEHGPQVTHDASFSGTQDANSDVFQTPLQALSKGMNTRKLWEVVGERIGSTASQITRLTHSATEKLPEPPCLGDEGRWADQT